MHSTFAAATQNLATESKAGTPLTSCPVRYWHRRFGCLAPRILAIERDLMEFKN
jgi:hypothetical protein